MIQLSAPLDRRSAGRRMSGQNKVAMPSGVAVIRECRQRHCVILLWWVAPRQRARLRASDTFICAYMRGSSSLVSRAAVAQNDGYRGNAIRRDDYEA
jgi:hypothetical protein